MALQVETVRSPTPEYIQYSQDDRDAIVRNIHELVKERLEQNPHHEVLFFEYSPKGETYNFKLYERLESKNFKELTVLKKDFNHEGLMKYNGYEFFQDIYSSVSDVTIIDVVFNRVFTGSHRVHWGCSERSYTITIPSYQERNICSKLPHNVDYFDRRCGPLTVSAFFKRTFADLNDNASSTYW